MTPFFLLPALSLLAGAHLAGTTYDSFATGDAGGGAATLMAENRVGQPWTAGEDELLRQAVAVHGPHDNWKAVAQGVPGRTNKACRKVRHVLALLSARCCRLEHTTPWL